MATKIWGPLFWNFIHDVANIYDLYWNKWTQKMKQKMMQFWKILKGILPCHYCRQSYKKYYSVSKPQYPFVDWAGELHNKVNEKLGTPQYDISFLKRKTIVYSSFSHTYTFIDLQFILALNYSRKEKKNVYLKWFRFIPYLLKLMIKEKHYNKDELQCFFQFSEQYLDSKLELLNWLRSCLASHQSLSIFLKKYSKAIAHNHPEEISLICGNLLNKK
jgi:hypothetical protein